MNSIARTRQFVQVSCKAYFLWQTQYSLINTKLLNWCSPLIRNTVKFKIACCAALLGNSSPKFVKEISCCDTVLTPSHEIFCFSVYQWLSSKIDRFTPLSILHFIQSNSTACSNLINYNSPSIWITIKFQITCCAIHLGNPGSKLIKEVSHCAVVLVAPQEIFLS